MKILAVDDDPVFQDILIEALRVIGQEDITKAGSAAAALAILRSPHHAYDCILLDIQMPDMDGVSLCRVLRNLPEYRRVPIVMITSQSAKRYIDDAFAAGATDYVTKPLDRLDLKARIGMVARLVEERHELELLTRQASQRNDTLEMQLDFDSPILVPGFDRGIEMLALENYLLTLGKKGLLSLSAFGIHIENAGLIFSKVSRAGFVDMLGDVASAIADAIKMDDVHIAYAGEGNFVGLTSKELAAPPQEMSGMIEMGLADFESFYSSERLPLPRVSVGPLVKSPFFALGSPTRILDRAISLAKSSREKKPGNWEHAA
jgi:CheY-like chemotaxis protein